MLLYTVRRLLASVLVLLASSLLVFVLTAATVDPLAQFRTRQPPPAARVLRRRSEAELGLDQPIFARYWDWLTGVLHRRLRQQHRRQRRSGRRCSPGSGSPRGW